VDDQLGKGHLPVGAARKDDIQARKLSRGGEICKRDQNRLPGPHTAGHRHHAKSKGYRKVSKSNGDPILYSFLKLFSVHTAARSVFYFLNIAFSKPCVFKFYHPILFPSTIFSFCQNKRIKKSLCGLPRKRLSCFLRYFFFIRLCSSSSSFTFPSTRKPLLCSTLSVAKMSSE